MPNRLLILAVAFLAGLAAAAPRITKICVYEAAAEDAGLGVDVCGRASFDGSIPFDMVLRQDCRSGPVDSVMAPAMPLLLTLGVVYWETRPDGGR